ncbi:hypothetical protein A1O1_05288 [Capronia coronata CBS 617.96]|uniref:Uncharacterized protein n=1 Tax=Capronia coronata CBS 617.96 TaxID=1182541 RepID=W9Y780_9EURO|nr:uncharacterized protein A1O1_05288 [Capronia coronata CBS 617.96]EXJ88358.1 hypothetical protein A1O1_05288 [Capronia coronata CBS 617.96]
MASYATAEWLPVNELRNHFTGKRRAEDDLESQSNISSHFKKLRLNQAVPHPGSASFPSSSPQISPSTTTAAVSFRPENSIPPNVGAATTHPSTSAQYDSSSSSSAPYVKMPTMSDGDFMPVDETPTRVIISNLDAEIAQIEADEAAAASAVFLPDIDKKVSAIPSRVLRHRAPAAPPENLSSALVLYREPTSITVPEEMDAVRKAIVAARARAREKQAEELRETQRQEALRETGGTAPEIDLDDAIYEDTAPADDEELDADAMEIG